MGVIQSRQRTISSRHQRAIDYALYQLKHSALEKYITNIFLYGSCARNEAKWSSDVDLCVILKPSVQEISNYHQIVHQIKGTISEDELYSVETDIKFIVGDECKNDSSLYLKNIRKDGISIWQ